MAKTAALTERVQMLEAELESVVPGRIPYKLYHAPAPKSAK